jgi:small-conductance mechanosensitive channel
MTEEQQQTGETPEAPAVESFDGWLAGQTEPVKALLTQHTSGLKSALDAERNERKAQAKQLRDALAKAEKGSETERALQDITERVAQAERRASFFEEASRPDVGCTNVRAAYLVATAESLFTKAGDPDWKRIKDEAPELFQRKQSIANAGNGTQAPPKTGGMNDFIRRSSGR